MNSLDANRTAKALRLVDVLRAHQATAAEARTMADGVWETVAELAEVQPPSQATRDIVITILEQAEKHLDPFAGLS